MAECVGSAFDLCDGFAIRLPALNPSEWKPKSAIYSAVSAYPVIRSELSGRALRTIPRRRVGRGVRVLVPALSFSGVPVTLISFSRCCG